MKPCKRLISFSQPQYDKLKAKAELLGLSVSELVRRIVDGYFETGDSDERGKEEIRQS